MFRLSRNLVFLIFCVLNFVTRDEAVTIPADVQKPLPGHNDGIAVADQNINVTATRPFWAIAHRVLTKDAIDAALNLNANALEIDMQPWERERDRGWWACHDRNPTGWGDTAEVMFNYIAERRRYGANIAFVWLDIKSPDMCDTMTYYGCSVMALQDLARKILLPAGVKVMYGLYGSDVEAPDSPTYYRLVFRGLGPGETMNIDGDFDTVKRVYAQKGKGIGGYPPLPLHLYERTMAKGLFSIRWNFASIKTELEKGSQSHEFKRVFGWTILDNSNDDTRAGELISEAGVDGLIFGNKISNFDDSSSTRGARDNIKRALEKNENSVHLATFKEVPW